MFTTDVAELTGKRHDHVMRDARKMLVEVHGEGAPQFWGYRSQRAERPGISLLPLPKRELTVLVTGYSVAMRAPLVDRAEQLEAEPPVR